MVHPLTPPRVPGLHTGHTELNGTLTKANALHINGPCAPQTFSVSSCLLVATNYSMSASHPELRSLSLCDVTQGSATSPRSVATPSGRASAENVLFSSSFKDTLSFKVGNGARPTTATLWICEERRFHQRRREERRSKARYLVYCEATLS